MPQTPIPITVFTGFLGSGKTSIILSLLPKLPKDYKVVLLKNEFGDVEGGIETILLLMAIAGDLQIQVLTRNMEQSTAS